MPNPPYEVLDRFPSSSSDVIYEVRRGADGVVYCCCPAWRMKQGKASCKHLDTWRKRSFRRPSTAHSDPALRIQDVQVGDLVEVNCRGDIFLLKVALRDNSALRGFEMLDAGEDPCSRGGERIVDFRDVTRVVVKAIQR